jgi:hypothetical protein
VQMLPSTLSHFERLCVRHCRSVASGLATVQLFVACLCRDVPAGCAFVVVLCLFCSRYLTLQS